MINNYNFYEVNIIKNKQLIQIHAFIYNILLYNQLIQI